MRQRTHLIIGIGIALLLLASYFIRVPVEFGAGYEVYSPLLGLLIFYQPIVLGMYVVGCGYFIFKGIRGRIRLV